MSPCEQGMIAFLLITLLFMGTTLYFALKLDRVQGQLNQAQQKSTQFEHHHTEKRKSKQG
jgi:hypothetical protein